MSAKQNIDFLQLNGYYTHPNFKSRQIASGILILNKNIISKCTNIKEINEAGKSEIVKINI